MTSGVYMITLLATDERYIGSSKNIEYRLNGHKLEGVLKGVNIMDYTFEILEHIEDVSTLREREWELCLELNPELNKQIPDIKRGVGFWTLKRLRFSKGLKSTLKDTQISLRFNGETLEAMKIAAKAENISLSDFY